MSRNSAAFVLGLAIIGVAPHLFSQGAQQGTRADLRAELAVDAAERRIYRPRFSFEWLVGRGGGNADGGAGDRGGGSGRVFLDASYLQRMNGRLQGSIDYWLRAGGGFDLASGFSLEASLSHFCRHLTSIDNGYVLNLNELTAAVRWHGRGVEAEVGYGRYVGGSPGYGGLAVFHLAAEHALIPELSFEGRWTWVDFGTLLHDVTLAVDLGRGIEIFLRSARTYGLDTETFLGLRLSGGAEDALKRAVGAPGSREPENAPRPLESLRLSSGFYPFYNSHKLLVDGAFRLELAGTAGGAPDARSAGGPDSRESGGRLLADLEFDAPILTGSGFFTQFWPDRMIYRARVDYEKGLGGGLFGAWYARYDVDMPVDRAVPFLASLSTGAAIRNQLDFDRLEKAFRFEAWAGLDFKYDYDVGLKLGLNTTARAARETRGAQAQAGRGGGGSGGAVDAGAELRWQANGMREAAEFKIFGEFGGAILVRPFVGIKKISYAAGGTPGPGTLAERITAGVALYRWF